MESLIRGDDLNKQAQMMDTDSEDIVDGDSALRDSYDDLENDVEMDD